MVTIGHNSLNVNIGRSAEITLKIFFWNIFAKILTVRVKGGFLRLLLKISKNMNVSRRMRLSFWKLNFLYIISKYQHFEVHYLKKKLFGRICLQNFVENFFCFFDTFLSRIWQAKTYLTEVIRRKIWTELTTFENEFCFFGKPWEYTNLSIYRT